MPTERQLLRDKEYYGEYKIGGRYSIEQWEKILSTPILVDSTDLSILKEIFSSSNHAAPLPQLCFHHNKKEGYYIDRMNKLGEKLGRPNHFSPEVDLQGNEFWWYFLFWGKITKEGNLEWKLQPALAEALENLDPELEKNYIAYMSHLDYCHQSRITQEDAVWIAAALLLFEKYHLEQPSSKDDLLLMQYEIQQRAQKIYGQDVDVTVITEYCNADSPRCNCHYLKDIDKYWRITYPNEFESYKERPTTVESNFCFMSYFGYITLQDLYDFVETDYARLVNPNFIEINTSDSLYQMISFLKENAGNGYMNLSAPTEEQIEHFLTVKTKGKNALQLFHSIGEMLIEQYPNFTQTEKADWLTCEKTSIQTFWKNSFRVSTFSQDAPSISTLFLMEEKTKNINFFIYLLFPIKSEEEKEKILELCHPLTTLTSANIYVDSITETPLAKLEKGETSICAYVSYTENELLEGGEESFLPQFETVLQIFASYYSTVCEQLSLTTSNSQTESPSDFSDNLEKNSETQTAKPSSYGDTYSVQISQVSSKKSHLIERVDEADRRNTKSGLYPKNILLVGKTGMGKTGQAIRLAVSIIDNLNPEREKELSGEEILSRYHRHREENHIYYSTIWETTETSKAFFKEQFIRFASKAGKGSYVFILEYNGNKNFSSLFGNILSLLAPEKREGAKQEESILLPEMEGIFSIPSNLYLIVTTSSYHLPANLTRIFRRELLTFRDDFISDLRVNQIEIGNLLHKLNNRIAYFLSSDYQIGHEFFSPLCTTPTVDTLGQIFYSQILPLLEEWFEKDYQKIRLIFGDETKSSPQYEMIQKEILTASLLFGVTTEEIHPSSKEIFRVQRGAFFLEKTYLEI